MNIMVQQFYCKEIINPKKINNIKFFVYPNIYALVNLAVLVLWK